MTTILFSSCAPAGPEQSGSAGQGDHSNTPTPQFSSDGSVSGMANGNGNAGAAVPQNATFYSKPTIEITTEAVPGGDAITISELSISSMGTGNFQITYPSSIAVGDTGTIDIIVVPNTVEITKTDSASNSNLGGELYQVIQDTVDVYPYMRADLKGEDSLLITSDGSPEKAVTSSRSVEWYWLLTPSKVGRKTLILSISVPITIFGKASNYQLKIIKLQVVVDESSTMTPSPVPTATGMSTNTPTFTPTPIPTQTRIPTNTPIPSIGEQLSGSAVATLGIFSTACIGLLTVLIGFLTYFLNRNKMNQEREDRELKKKKEDNAHQLGQEILDGYKSAKEKRKTSKKQD
jgi:hypothetical protein